MMMTNQANKLSKINRTITALTVTLLGYGLTIQPAASESLYTKCVDKLIFSGVLPDRAAKYCIEANTNRDPENPEKNIDKPPVAMDGFTFNQFLSQINQNWLRKLEFVQSAAKDSFLHLNRSNRLFLSFYSRVIRRKWQFIYTLRLLIPKTGLSFRVVLYLHLVGIVSIDFFRNN